MVERARRNNDGIFTRKKPESITSGPMERATPTPGAVHAHNWKIPSPDGATSVGECVDKGERKGCGAKKEFKNVLPLEHDFLTSAEQRQAF